MISGLHRCYYVTSVSVLFIILTLIAGISGCSPEQYNLTISSTEGGEVTTPGEETFTYNEGTLVELVAEPEDGYGFVNWISDWIGDVSAIADANDATTTIIMNDDHTIAARFAQPIWLSDWYDLDAIRNDMGRIYILMNDLDSTTPGYSELASDTANQGKGWQPIGYYREKPLHAELFQGIFDGQGHEIRDLFINRPEKNEVGLFGYVDVGGLVQNVRLVNAIVTGDERVGGLVGRNAHGTVSNSYSTGSVSGSVYVGGLVGDNWGTVVNCYSTDSVTGDEFVGGVMGFNVGDVVTCYSTGSVIGEVDVGGLVGMNEGIVNNSYSTGSVTGDGWAVGGLAGDNTFGTLSNCYAMGNVTGDSAVGGLLGVNQGYWGKGYPVGIVSNCYSTGSVTGNEDVGGLVGRNDKGIVRKSVWDIETSGQSTSDGGTGKTTSQMKSIGTFSWRRWNIIAVANPGVRNPSHIWNIVDDETYPFLSWQS